MRSKIQKDILEYLSTQRYHHAYYAEVLKEMADDRDQDIHGNFKRIFSRSVIGLEKKGLVRTYVHAKEKVKMIKKKRKKREPVILWDFDWDYRDKNGNLEHRYSLEFFDGKHLDDQTFTAIDVDDGSLYHIPHFVKQASDSEEDKKLFDEMNEYNADFRRDIARNPETWIIIESRDYFRPVNEFAPHFKEFLLWLNSKGMDLPV